MAVVSEGAEILGLDSGESTRKRGGKKAVLRFGLTLSRTTLDKAHVWLAISTLCEACVLSEERHSDGEGSHYHAYLQLRSPQTVVQTRESLQLGLFGDTEAESESLHLDTLRNPKHWIKYITKEDIAPLYDNVDPGMFHQAWKIHDYIANNEQFDPMHAFCRQNPSLINILRRSHASYWDAKYTEQLHKEIDNAKVVPDFTVAWVMRVKQALDFGQHVYLYGESGLGKTTLVNFMCATRPGYVPLGCRQDQFEWSDVQTDTRYLVAGDAPAGYVPAHRSTLLKLCDRTLVSVNVKCGALRRVYFKGQIVIVSNFPPAFLDDPALVRRFCIIQADCDGVRSSLAIKQEEIYVSSEENMATEDSPFLISSDEE